MIPHSCKRLSPDRFLRSVDSEDSRIVGNRMTVCTWQGLWLLQSCLDGKNDSSLCCLWLPASVSNSNLVSALLWLAVRSETASIMLDNSIQLVRDSVSSCWTLLA